MYLLHAEVYWRCSGLKGEDDAEKSGESVYDASYRAVRSDGDQWIVVRMNEIDGPAEHEKRARGEISWLAANFTPDGVHMSWVLVIVSYIIDDRVRFSDYNHLRGP